jgi:hypothetical protein
LRNELITTSTAGSPLGVSSGRKLLRVPSGTYANRLVLLYQDTPSSISLRFADAPYTSWSAAQSIATDSADSSFDCWMSANGDIYLTYTAATSFDLLYRQLTFSGGAWTVGSVNTVYSVDDCYFPSVILEQPNRLWITYTRVAGGSSYINAIKSDDWGVTWTTGAGEELAGPDTSAYSKIIIANDRLYVFYTIGGTKLAERSKYFFTALYSAEVPLASGSGLDQHFHASVAQDNRIGVVFDDGTLNYREFDGSQWLAVEPIDSSGGTYPRVKFFENTPTTLYLQSFGANQTRLLTSTRQNGAFLAGADLLTFWRQLDSVILFSQSAGTYADMTAESASSAVGDVFHPSTSGILDGAGDAVYFGHSAPFNYLKLILATTGIGGAVDWQYFDGSGWVTFTPTDGAFHLTTSSRELTLWSDGSAIPDGWQQTVVNGVTKFFVRAVVNSAFTTKPVATQLTAITNLSEFITEA